MASLFKRIKALFIVSDQEQTASNPDMLFKNLKSLFIVPAENSNPEKDPTEATSEELSMDNPEVQEIMEELNTLDDFDERLAAALEGEIIDKDGVIDQKIVENLLRKVGEHNLEGFDYFEYRQSLKALDKMPMDEATKYRSAYATASTMGISLQHLLDSATFYLEVLQQQDENFQKEAEQKKQKQVNQKEAEAARLEKQIEEYEEKIKQLQEKIKRNQIRIEEITREVKIDKVTIDKERNNFLASFNFLRSEFVDDIAKMKKYLK